MLYVRQHIAKTYISITLARLDSKQQLDSMPISHNTTYTIFFKFIVTKHSVFSKLLKVNVSGKKDIKTNSETTLLH